MNIEKYFTEESEKEIAIKKCMTFISKLFSQESYNSSRKQEKIKTLNAKKKTIEVHLPIAVINGSPKTARRKNGIKDLYLFEYEYKITSEALFTNSKLRTY